MFSSISKNQNPVPKCPKTYKIKNKGQIQYENNSFKLVLKTCQTFAENYYMNSFFPKIGIF